MSDQLVTTILSIENCTDIMSVHIIVLYCQIIILASFWLHKDTYFVVWNRWMAELDRYIGGCIRQVGGCIRQVGGCIRQVGGCIISGWIGDYTLLYRDFCNLASCNR